ncbi:hypothetical protein AB2888_24790, partial [Escherichia coli]
FFKNQFEWNILSHHFSQDFLLPVLQGAVPIGGLRSFALELQSASKPVVPYQWSPVAGGNNKLARLLKRFQ